MTERQVRTEQLLAPVGQRAQTGQKGLTVMAAPAGQVAMGLRPGLQAAMAARAARRITALVVPAESAAMVAWAPTGATVVPVAILFLVQAVTAAVVDGAVMALRAPRA